MEIPKDIRAFMDEVVDSFAMWDLLIFISKWEDDMDTPARMAQLLGRQMEEVLKPIHKLEKMGIVSLVKRPDGEFLCRVNSNTPFLPFLKKFGAFNGNQEDRLRILSYLLQKSIR